MSEIENELIDQAPKVEEKVKADADKVEDSVENLVSETSAEVENGGVEHETEHEIPQEAVNFVKSMIDPLESRFNDLTDFLKQHGIYFKG